MRSYADELARCQRYYSQIPLPEDGSTGGYVMLPKNGYYESHSYQFAVPMRAAPSISSSQSWVIRELNGTSNVSYSGLTTYSKTQRFYMGSHTTNNSNFY